MDEKNDPDKSSENISEKVSSLTDGKPYMCFLNFRFGILQRLTHM